MAASSSAVRRRAPARSRLWTSLGVLGLLALVVVVVVPLLFAGSKNELADGTSIAGVDVGGLSAGRATALLERRAAQLEKRILLSQCPVLSPASRSR